MVDQYNHFICIVAGNNPDELLEPYDNSKHKEKVTVYKYADREKIKDIYLSLRKELAEKSVTEEEKKLILNDIEEVKEMTADEFYFDYTGDFTLDEKTGDAIDYKNPQGKWDTARLGRVFASPFILKDGSESYSARICDIDWDKVHGNGKEMYRKLWDMVMDGVPPETEVETTMYENMKNRTEYFRKFGDKDTYVTSNTSFWGFAFLSNMIGWKELDDTMDQFTWMSCFYDIYIKTLPQDTLLSIYECTRN